MAVANDKLRICPTLLVGLGGTGKDVLLRVRKQFHDRHSERTDGVSGYPIIGYLVLDTDKNKLDDIAPVAGEPGLPQHVRDRIKLQEAGDPPEFVYCRVTSAEFDDYFSGGEAVHRHVFQWMPAWMGSRYQSTAMEEGAGQNRLFGRLAFFHNYDTIRKTLTARLREIHAHAVNTQRPWLPADAVLDESRIEVMLVYSLAGGTGCGMFLDMGFLIRSIMDEFFKDKTVHITHFAYLPQVLTSGKGAKMPETLRTKVHENAFAALKEMEYLANRQQSLFDLSIPPRNRGTDDMVLYEARWKRDGAGYAVKAAPWDTCYLIDASNDPRGGAPVQYSDLYQMVAEYIYLDFDLSDFGAQKRSARSNLKAQTELLVSIPIYDQDGGQLFSRSVSRRFSAFGLSQIQFDRDRMRRAAAYRLATHLTSWWRQRGTSPLLPEQLDELATKDFGAEDVKAIPLRTPFDTNTTLTPLSSTGVTMQLLRHDLQSERLHTDDVERETNEIRKKLEDKVIDPLTSDPFADWIRQHQRRLTPPPIGAAPDDSAGQVARGFARIEEDLAKRIVQRVDVLFRFRVDQLGLQNAVALFERYTARVTEALARTDRMATAGGGDWADRLADARRIPLRSAARNAARSELLRAVDLVRKQIKGLYQKAVMPALRNSLARVRRLVGQDRNETSYGGTVDRFYRLLVKPTGVHNVQTGTCDYLEDRFKELKGKSSGQLVEGQGDKVIDEQRVITLIDDLPEAEYDRYIARALKVPSIAEMGRDDWQRIEDQVLKSLTANTSIRELKGVQTLADLALAVFPVDRESPVSQAWADRLAEELARACQSLLGTFKEHVTALQLFDRQANKPVLLEHLRKMSSPFLRRNTGVQAAKTADIDTLQYLGLANPSQEADRGFVHSLKQAADNTPSMLTNLKAFRMDDDAIIVYQEKAGVPLLYAYELNTLGDAYDASTRPGELHLDPVFARHAPEIRWVQAEEQRKLAQCLELALLGMMTDQIAYTVGDGNFHFVSRSRFGMRQPLGGTLDRVVRTLALSPDLRNDLIHVIDAWYQRHTTPPIAGGPAGERDDAVLALWAAHWHLYFVIRDRVSATTGSAIPGAGQHPLLGIIRDRMIPRVITRLPVAAHPTYETLKAIVDVADYSSDPAEQARALAAWRQKVTGAFTAINEDDLPIPVLTRTPRISA